MAILPHGDTGSTGFSTTETLMARKSIPSGHWCFTSRVVDQRQRDIDSFKRFLRDRARCADLEEKTIILPGHRLTIKNPLDHPVEVSVTIGEKAA